MSAMSPRVGGSKNGDDDMTTMPFHPAADGLRGWAGGSCSSHTGIPAEKLLAFRDPHSVPVLVELAGTALQR